MKLDSFKTENIRKSTQILDYLGDVGGFEGSLQMFFVILGQYFSAKYFAASISQTLYIKKKSQKELEQDDIKSINSMFKKIQITDLQVILDPILRFLTLPC